MNTTENKRPHPIFGTNIDLPPAEVVEEVRMQLAKLRGNLSDIRRAYPIWKDFLSYNEGAMTCLLVSLADSRRHMENHQKKWGHNPSWLSNSP